LSVLFTMQDQTHSLPAKTCARRSSVVHQQACTGRMSTRVCQARGLARNKSIYTLEPCMLCVSARRLGSSQVVAVDPVGFRHRTTQAGGKGRAAWRGSDHAGRGDMSPLGARPLHGVCYRPSHAGLGGTASRHLDRQSRACLLLRRISPLVHHLGRRAERGTDVADTVAT